MYYTESMKYCSWNHKKNRQLKAERNVSFEEVVFYIERGHLLDVVEHPNQERYRGQRIFVVEIRDNAYLVPFVETEREIFLQTIIPNRKATKDCLRGDQDGRD